MSVAVDIFLKQIFFTGGIPFDITLPKPLNINADMMSVSQIRELLDEGLSDIDNGRELSAREVFSKFRETHNHETI